MSFYVRINYMYRDGGNFKNHGDRRFSNPVGIPINEIENRLSLAAQDGIFFIAKQVGLPELFLFLDGNVTEDDHCYHELASVERVTRRPEVVDERSVGELLNEFEHAAKIGWKEFLPLTKDV